MSIDWIDLAIKLAVGVFIPAVGFAAWVGRRYIRNLESDNRRLRQTVRELENIGRRVNGEDAEEPPRHPTGKPSRKGN